MDRHLQTDKDESGLLVKTHDVEAKVQLQKP